MSETHASSIKSYVMVIASLAVLTGLTVLLSYLHLPHNVAIPLAMLIAATKVTLIASVFMHLKGENKAIYWLVFAGVFFVAVLVLALIPDIGVLGPWNK